MAKSKYDIGLILSLGLIIAIGGYWFVKELPMNGVEHYIDLLGDRFMSLIPKGQEKQEIAQIYDQFKNKVKEKKISPEHIEQVASAIFNLSNMSDSLAFDEAEALMRRAVREIPVDSEGTMSIPDIKVSPAEWEALNDRLSSVYQLDELLQDKVDSISVRVMPPYRIDKDLNIIIDKREKTKLEHENLLKKLEAEKRLFWADSVTENMQKELHQLENKVKSLSVDVDLKHKLLKLKILTQPITEKIDSSIDSLELETVLNWDSLQDIVTKEVKKVDTPSK